MNLQEQYREAERQVARIENERNVSLSKLDEQIEAAEQNPMMPPDAIEKLRARREAAERAYHDILEKARKAAENRQAELAAWQAQQDAKNREHAEHEERLAKAKARHIYPGTDIEFEAAWPALWEELKRRRVSETEAKGEERPFIHL